MVLVQRQWVLIAGHDKIGVDRESVGDDMVVIRIAADWVDLGQRRGEQPPELFQFIAPCKDPRVAMAVAIPQAGGEKCESGFIDEQRREMQNELALMGQLSRPGRERFRETGRR